MLGYNKILKEVRKGNITINKFDLKQLNPNSYDVRLGNWFAQERVANEPVYLNWPGATDQLWQPLRFVDEKQQCIIEPGEYILAQTEEIIGSIKYATLLKARSTIARAGLDICASAGFGDVGYVAKWTLEIKNQTKNSIVLMPGMRLAQIAFFEVKEAVQYSGTYMSPNNFVSSFNLPPTNMLPVLGSNRVF